MKKIIISLIAGGLLGTVFGFALGIFIYPFWFLRDVATEQVAGRESKKTLASGQFLHVDPSDPVHWGKGSVTLFSDPGDGTRIVHLEEDFEVGPGPRFHVYLVTHGAVRNESDFLGAQTVDLGRLRAFKGSQTYPIASDVDLANYKSIVIWCKEFDVLISPASLKEAPR